MISDETFVGDPQILLELWAEGRCADLVSSIPLALTRALEVDNNFVFGPLQENDSCLRGGKLKVS